MFKYFVLSTLLAVVAARPGLLHGGAVALPSAIIGSVPTALSSHSSSVVHSATIAAAPVVHAAPIVAQAPALLAAPAPAVLSAPILSSNYLTAPALGHGLATLGHGVALGHGLHI